MPLRCVLNLQHYTQRHLASHLELQCKPLALLGCWVDSREYRRQAHIEHKWDRGVEMDPRKIWVLWIAKKILLSNYDGWYPQDGRTLARQILIRKGVGQVNQNF